MLKFHKLYIILLIAVLPSKVVCAQEHATLNLSDTTNQTISRYIYGQFAEHLGRNIYDGFYRNGKIRMDIVDAMKEIKVPLLRWPGGCFADQYHWRDGMGDLKKRPSTVNTSWGWVTDDNSFGTDEVMQLCDLIGCDAYIAGNMGTGTPEEMENWVEYLNFDGLDPKNNITIQANLPKEVNGKTVSGQVLTSAKFDDINTFENKHKVKTEPFNGATLNNNQLQAELPPMSVTLIEIKP